MKFVFIVFSLLLSLHLIANPADSVRSEQRDEGLFVVHEVEEEETIYSIARRYGSSVSEVIKHNEIVDNRIEIGQTIFVQIKQKDSSLIQMNTIKLDSSRSDVHIVQKGETLYSISKKYDVRLKDLKKWNDLSNNDLPLGMILKLSETAKIPTETTSVVQEPVESIDSTSNEIEIEPLETDPFEGFEKYLVQTGETLSTIANKIGVGIDSLKIWNSLDEDYLKIGQQLFFKPSEDVEKASISKPKEKNRVQIDENGFERVFEEGVASVIQSMNTTKYLALHRTLPIGTNLEVRNLMNNQIVHVKVVGKLPDTGLNKNLLLRLSEPAYDQLGILDSKSRVEVSYSKQ